MRKYAARRLLLFIPSLLAASLIIFLLVRVMPADIISVITSGGEGGMVRIEPQAMAAIRKELGIDKPLVQQYIIWLGNFVRLDFSRSFLNNRPILHDIKDRFPITLELALLATLLSMLIAIPAGVASALWQDRPIDYVVRILSIAGLAMPGFWTGILLLLGAAFFLGWSPPMGYTPLQENPLRNLQQLVLPVAVLGYGGVGIIARLTRSAMLEVLRQDYIRTAWSKGLHGRGVVFRHALKNALIPVVTLSGIQFGHLLGGTVLIERVFALPGMGLGLVEGVSLRDYPAVQAYFILLVFWMFLVNLVVDLLYGWLDPRIVYR